MFLIYKLSNESDDSNKIIQKQEEKEISDFENLSYKDAEEYAKKKKLEIKTNYEYSDSIEKDKIIEGNIYGNTLNLLISLGSIPVDKLKEKNVNELGKVPIMMYHGIVNTTENKYTGGNVDKDGYNRTSCAFL